MVRCVEEARGAVRAAKGKGGGYVPASEMNRRVASIVTAFGDGSGDEKGYPPNIEVVCHYDYGSEGDGESASVTSGVKPSSVLSSPTESEKLEMVRMARRWIDKEGMFVGRNNLHPCKVLYREQSGEGADDTYMVTITHRDDYGGGTKNRLVKNIPRRAILFRNKPYTSDQQLVNAFRHSIAIPDDMLPPSWKNI